MLWVVWAWVDERKKAFRKLTLDYPAQQTSQVDLTHSFTPTLHTSACGCFQGKGLLDPTPVRTHTSCFLNSSLCYGNSRRWEVCWCLKHVIPTSQLVCWRRERSREFTDIIPKPKCTIPYSCGFKGFLGTVTDLKPLKCSWDPISENCSSTQSSIQQQRIRCKRNPYWSSWSTFWETQPTNRNTIIHCGKK